MCAPKRRRITSTPPFGRTLSPSAARLSARTPTAHPCAPNRHPYHLRPVGGRLHHSLGARALRKEASGSPLRGSPLRLLAPQRAPLRSSHRMRLGWSACANAVGYANAVIGSACLGARPHRPPARAFGLVFSSVLSRPRLAARASRSVA